MGIWNSTLPYKVEDTITCIECTRQIPLNRKIQKQCEFLTNLSYYHSSNTSHVYWWTDEDEYLNQRILIIHESDTLWKAEFYTSSGIKPPQ